MEKTGTQGSRAQLVALGAAVALVAAIFPASANAAPFADACGVLRQSEMARALRQGAVDETRTALRLPGNSAGVLRDRCAVLAFTGHQPRTPRQEGQQLRDGSAGSLRMETWVPDEGPNAESWRGNFAGVIKGLTSQARRSFIQGQGGRVVKLPLFGVRHALGFMVVRNGLAKVRAFWWDPPQASIVSMLLIESPRKPILTSIKDIARKVVPAIK